jgi:hypothetical protein
MFFVGHMATAFIISYVISIKFSVKAISIPLVMLLSILPDIDIIFRLAGIELGHRTITHSAIISIIVASIFIATYRKRAAVAAKIKIYSIAYLTHIVIGDVIIGPVINILYPFGDLLISSGINGGSITHILIEIFLLTIMTALVIREYYCNRYHGFVFQYSKFDGLLYPMLILAVVISLIYLLYGSEFHSLLLVDDHIKVLLILLSHIVAISLITFIWMKSKSRIEISKLKEL